MTDEYDYYPKQTAWEAFLKSWDMNNRGNMDLDPIHVNTAQTQFERWWSREQE